MSRSYAAVPHEYLEEMSELSDEEFGRLMRGLLLYSREGVPIEASGNERFYVRRVMNREDGLKASYEEIAERNRSNGRKGGRPRKNPETQKNPEKPNETERNPEEPKETQKTQDEVEVKDEVKSLVKFTSLASSEFIGGIGESEGEDAAALPAAEERAPGDGGKGAAEPAPGADAKGDSPPRRKARKPTARQKAVATYEEMAGKYALGAIPPKVDEQFRRWISHRYEKRVPITDTTMAGMLQKTTDAVLQYGEDQVADLFDLCITSGWTGVFFERLKEQPGPRGQPARKAAGPRDQTYDFDSLEKKLNAAGG